MDISDDLSLSQVQVIVPTTSTFLFTFAVNVHLGFELFFVSGLMSYLTALKIVIVSKNRAVPTT